MQIQQEEINKLIYDYLKQQNYRHTAFEFENEAPIVQDNFDYSLINIINKAETEAVYERNILGLKPIIQKQQIDDDTNYSQLEFKIKSQQADKYDFYCIKIQNEFTLAVIQYNNEQKLYNFVFYVYNPIIQKIELKATLNDIELYKFQEKYLYYYKKQVLTQFSLDQFEQNEQIMIQTNQIYINQNRIITDSNLLTTQLTLDKQLNYVQEGLLLGANQFFYIKLFNDHVFVYFYDHHYSQINLDEFTNSKQKIKCYCDNQNSFLLYDQNFIYKFQVIDYIPILTWKLELQVQTFQKISKYVMLINDYLVDYDNGQILYQLSKMVERIDQQDNTQDQQVQQNDSQIINIVPLQDITYIFYQDKLLILDEENIKQINFTNKLIIGGVDQSQRNIFLFFENVLVILQK